jgi:hypothetical protein
MRAGEAGRALEERPAAHVRGQRGGRVCRFREETGAAILARIEAGEALTAICQDPRMPAAKTVRAWADRYPEFGHALATARMGALAVTREAVARRDAARAARRQPGRGRPTGYAYELGQAICRRLVEGETLTRICRDEGMPGIGTVYDWIHAHADFAEAYVTAREVQAHVKFDQVWDVASEAREDGWRTARLKFDVLRWQCSKLLPTRYGAKLEDLKPPPPKTIILTEFQWLDAEGKRVGDPVPGKQIWPALEEA